jgi:hypothetical protein
LWADTDVSEENASSVVRVEVCRFRNKLGYIAELQRRLLWDPRRRGKEMSPILTNGEKWTRWFIVTGGKWNNEKERYTVGSRSKSGTV